MSGGKRQITVKAIIALPTMPNFFRIDGGGTIDVADVSDDGLREIGAVWTEALVEHANDRRAASRGKGE